ncbi:type-F conjugative transfer system pilin acetylase TraX [Klebsiella sp. WOUb02]|uniref:type-F conjugative transfer system pilin acetylase TraX n=1 Tax=Klebsiella sp. WOUb02 TaxID=3161071 RepID=UPI003CF24A68
MMAADRRLQQILTPTPGQTDMIKTVALVLMVIDHAGLLLVGDNEVMRLLGRGCFPLFGLVWGMNLARHGDIRQSQLNSLWWWAVVAQGPFLLLGFPWWQGNILFAFAVTGQAIRWFSLRTRNDMLLAVALVVAWLPLSAASYGIAAVFMLINSWRVCRAENITERVGYAVLWAVMVLLMNPGDALQSVGGLAIAVLALAVCTDTGKALKGNVLPVAVGKDMTLPGYPLLSGFEAAGAAGL